jgi:hypothetical protein
MEAHPGTKPAPFRGVGPLDIFGSRVAGVIPRVVDERGEMRARGPVRSWARGRFLGRARADPASRSYRFAIAQTHEATRANSGGWSRAMATI